MSQTKAVIDFSDYTGADLAAKARYIHEQMVQHADVFPDPPISLAELGTLVEDYAEKLAARRSRTPSDPGPSAGREPRG